MADSTQQLDVLLSRVRGGDQEAVAQLVDQYEPRVRIAARMLLGPVLRPHLDSVDLTQSVHRTLLLGLRDDKFTFTTPAQLMALLLTIVRRKVARRWRSHQRERRAGSDANVREMLAQVDSPQPDPASVAQMHDAIDLVLEDLHETDRRLIELRLQGYKTVEAADELGLDAHILRARLSRLRERLRKHGLLNDWL